VNTRSIFLLLLSFQWASLVFRSAGQVVFFYFSFFFCFFYGKEAMGRHGANAKMAALAKKSFVGVRIPKLQRRPLSFFLRILLLLQNFRAQVYAIPLKAFFRDTPNFLSRLAAAYF